MQTPGSGPSNQNPKKGPKFNLYWIYGLFAIALITVQFWGPNFRGGVKQESFQTINRRFISQKIVDSMVVVGKTVEVYLKKDSLTSPRYAPLYNELKQKVKGPHYIFTIGNIEQFQRDMDAAEKDFSLDQKVKISYEEDTRSGVLSFILQFILPIAIMIGLWVLLMRKMGGGNSGGGPGGIFNIGKSKAQLFDKGTKVNITFNDVAGLDEAKVEVFPLTPGPAATVTFMILVWQPVAS